MAEADLLAVPMRAATDATPSRERGSWLRGNLGLTVSMAVLTALLLASFVAPLPYDPVAPDVQHVLHAPSGAHWFGTDSSGFDVLSRTLASPRRELPLAIGGTLLSLVIGVPFGLLASTRTRTAELIMRVLDVFQAFPLVIVALALVVITGNRLQNVVFAIAIINVPRFIRLIRTEALSLRESRFIEAATVTGCSPARILFRHILPNVASIVFVQCSLAAAYAVIVIASLNFLGIGVSPPQPTWGSMIQSGAQNIAQGQWWPVVFPSLALFIAVLCFNGIANGLDKMHGAS